MPRRKSTAQGRKPSGAPKTPPTQQPTTIAGVGQLTGARKVVEPAKGNQRQDTPRKTQAPQEEAQKPHQKRLNSSQPRNQQEERKETQLHRPRKNPHITSGTTRQEVRSANDKARHPRGRPKRRRGIRSEKATP